MCMTDRFSQFHFNLFQNTVTLMSEEGDYSLPLLHSEWKCPFATGRQVNSGLGRCLLPECPFQFRMNQKCCWDYWVHWTDNPGAVLWLKAQDCIFCCCKQELLQGHFEPQHHVLQRAGSGFLCCCLFVKVQLRMLVPSRSHLGSLSCRTRAGWLGTEALCQHWCYSASAASHRRRVLQPSTKVLS